jgi:outer membrane protein
MNRQCCGSNLFLYLCRRNLFLSLSVFFMKKLPLVLSIVALVCVCALFLTTFLCKPKGVASSAATNENAVVATGDIVYVNLDSLVRGYDMYFDLRNEFEAKVKSKENDFAARRKKLESEVRTFQEKIEKGLVTRSQAQQLQEDLQRKEQDVAQLGQQMQAELAEEEAVMLRRIQDNIQTFIQQYNADKGYRLILSNSGGNVVLYGESTLNITTDVLQGLNEAYVKVRKK